MNIEVLSLSLTYTFSDITKQFIYTNIGSKSFGFKIYSNYMASLDKFRFVFKENKIHQKYLNNVTALHIRMIAD